MSLELAFGDMLDAKLLQVRDAAALFPIGKSGLRDAQGGCGCDLRAEVVDELIKFHHVVLQLL